ncbi:hypothetical protein GCM10028820_24850 [Tessaracoccus terricola]
MRTRQSPRRPGVPVWLPVTAAVLVVLAGWLGTQLVVVQLGNRAWESGDPALAEQRYSTAVDVLAVKRWIAPFNRGVARHGLERHAEAAADFAAAAELAPSEHQCMVRLNWAWTLEADADSRAGKDAQAARTRYLEADAVLAAADCPDESPSQDGSQSQQEQLEATRERLEAKRTGNPPPADDKPDPSSDGTREQELQERQRQAQREFREAGEDRDSEPPGDGRRTW